MTEFVLKVLDLGKGLFRLLQVDYPTFRLLLWMKLTVDNRQEKSITQRSSKKDVSNAMLWVVVIYTFMGIFAGAVLLVISSVFVSMLIVFSLIMVMTAVALISDFTSVLLDTTDNAILLPRPIDSRTLAVARITHIVLYLLMITFSLSLATIIIGTIKFGPLFTLGFLFALILAVLFVVFISNVFYLLLLRISGEEKFRDVILYFQIFMAAFAMGSYQLMPRLLGIEQVRNVTVSIKWWTYFLPPAWLAAPLDALARRNMNSPALIMTLLGVFIPMLSIFVVIRYLAPGFSRALAQLGTIGEATQVRSGGDRGLGSFFSRLLCSDPAERSVFKMVWRLVSRDRKFKLKTYPTFGYMMIIAAILMLYNDGNVLEALRSLPGTKKYLILLYIGCVLIPLVILQHRFSDQYEAAWMYYALPFTRPGDILKGSFKALVIKFGLFIYMPLSLLVIFAWGIKTADDVMLAFANMLLSSIVIAFVVRKDLPFSRKYVAANEAMKGAAGFMTFMIPAGLGLFHFLLTYLPFAVPVCSVFMLLLVYIAVKFYGNTSWDVFSYTT